MEANIMLIKCVKEKKVFGARIQKTETNDWVRTWAFKINDKQAVNEGYDRTPIQGSLVATAEYPGCPYCKAKGFFKCARCGKLNCYDNEEIVVCAWCGNSGTTYTADEFSIDSSKF